MSLTTKQIQNLWDKRDKQMNTLKIEALLAKKYKYKPLKDGLSDKYRQFFKDNIPADRKQRLSIGRKQPVRQILRSISPNL